jgi:hypothetical protein
MTNRSPQNAGSGRFFYTLVRFFHVQAKHMPSWITDINFIASICSIVGLAVTIFLYFEARAIRQSFLRRARLPEVNKELTKINSQISSQLKHWLTDKAPALESFSRAKAILENTKPKLPSDQKNKVQGIIKKLSPRKCYIFNGSLSDLTEQLAWDIYTELSGVIMHLDQLSKDSKWD